MARLPSSIRRAIPLGGGVAATIQTVMVNVLVLGVNFGTGIITARALGADGRGAQAAMQMWPQVFAMALTIGLPTALLYNLRRHPEEGSRLFSAAMVIGTGTGVCATLVGAIALPFWLSDYPPEVVRRAQQFMLFSPLISLIGVFLAVLRAREEFTIFNAARYLLPGFTLLVLVLLTLTHHLTPVNAALAYMLPYVPVFLWLAIRLWRMYRPTLAGLRASFRSLTSYGVRSYGVDLLGQLVAGRLDQMLVVGLLNPTAMGLYVVAVSLARTLDAFAAALAQVILPKTASRPVDEVVALIGRGVRVSITVAVLAASLLAISGPWALRVVYGEEFLSAVPVFRLLLAEVVLSGTVWVLAQAFMASDKPGLVSLMQGVGVFLTVPLLLVLIPKFGLVGAGMAMLISTMVRFGFVLVNFPITLGVRPPRLWPKLEDFVAVFSGEGSDK